MESALSKLVFMYIPEAYLITCVSVVGHRVTHSGSCQFVEFRFCLKRSLTLDRVVNYMTGP